jgi:hypothetical protein
VNEAGVRARASDYLDCEEQLIKLESAEGPESGVARYRVAGCGRKMTIDCVENKAGEVSCRSAYGHGNTPSEGEGGEVASAVVGSAAGCACASLFSSSKDRDPEPSSSPSPMSTTQQRTKR